METSLKQQLSINACKVRMGVINGTFHAKSGHPGGSLSVADTLTYLYFHEMNIDPANPDWDDRDRFVLSKGHCAPALYAALANRGFFPVEELDTLRHIGSRLQGHPDMKNIPGVDMSTGSLGQGISAACGMALAAKLSNKQWRVFTVLGDGELEEGEVWEAAMFAAHNKLDNLIAVVDNNDLQIDGRLSEVCSPEPIDKKFEAFGWEVFKIDAHDFDQIEDAFTKANQVQGKPAVIIQRSIKGKGVSFMEDNVSWHGSAPNAEQRDAALEELKKTLAELEG
ncbi:Transketolase, thiamine diphosphate binding domain protein [[Clostridium] methylpentosum DSM 5476]|uniref:Transketolase, thiamine diphosphate binding domain protein n=1 Tax=[Clostridium] methylpentosum DSM 5476 TaxID=537013 RepID=C0EEQ5_9FIRM|nr:Transketolase, thiamine diphosphate binding domain protein [[Clostridium] methylpentosum DSM 5476]